MLTEKDIEEIKNEIEGVEILSEDWADNFKIKREKVSTNGFLYLELVNWCFSNLMTLKIYSKNENLSICLREIKINKIREMLNEFRLQVQPSKHFLLLRINEYVQNNRQNLDSLIENFLRIFSKEL